MSHFVTHVHVRKIHISKCRCFLFCLGGNGVPEGVGGVVSGDDPSTGGGDGGGGKRPGGKLTSTGVSGDDPSTWLAPPEFYKGSGMSSAESVSSSETASSTAARYWVTPVL